MRRWIWNILVSLDQTCGVILSPILFYRIQNPDETISSRIGKLARANHGVVPRRYPLAVIIYYIVDCIQPGHFVWSVEKDRD